MSDPFCEAHKRKAEEARKAFERAEDALLKGQIAKRMEDAKKRAAEGEKPPERYKPQWPI